MTGNAIEIRRLRPGDAGRFHTMAVASWLDAYAGILSPDLAADAPAMISSAMAARFDRFMVAFDGERPLGYYSLGDAPEDRAYFWHLYVDPAAQRQGVGAMLHNTALDELRGRGCTFAMLDYVAGNQKAARFYARHGWVETGRRFDDGLDLVVMRRML